MAAAEPPFKSELTGEELVSVAERVAEAEQVAHRAVSTLLRLGLGDLDPLGAELGDGSIEVRGAAELPAEIGQLVLGTRVEGQPVGAVVPRHPEHVPARGGDPVRYFQAVDVRPDREPLSGCR